MTLSHGPRTTALLVWLHNHIRRLRAYVAHLERIKQLGGPETPEGSAEALHTFAFKEAMEAHGGQHEALAAAAGAQWDAGREDIPEEGGPLYEEIYRLLDRVDALTQELLARY